MIHFACFSFIKVFDGPTSEAPILGNLCGSQHPTPITATQNIMFVRLRSDSSRRHRGFSAYFSEGKFLSDINALSLDHKSVFTTLTVSALLIFSIVSTYAEFPHVVLNGHSQKTI